jgi:hypothetical protein
MGYTSFKDDLRAYPLCILILFAAWLGMPEGGLLLYGGFDNERNVLSDCWRLDLSSGKNYFRDI